MTRVLHALSRLIRTRDGSVGIEFVMIVPVLLMMITSSFELGMVTMRQVMLDRGLDLTVRDIRLGAIVPVTHETVGASICDHALILPDCLTNLRLEMIPLDPRAWIAPPGTADCVDRADASVPLRRFTAGVQNELMLLRACSLFDPYFPTSGFGAQLSDQAGGTYALVSASAFVIEP
ncbi:TadE/TadG family type IV pilus assembly protein [Limimaricola cinnabarinus]|uniref:Flp pilus assembly protein TadG n=1 Tax=Limimaricola cinnabarinus LL-001 TaxID=1337093 RepID=U2Z6G8_9RHOB|nr:TadE/TadG family type IV pilus assembly protein [Limimaricola cinnabarinus]GAD57020.1 flp pilus assembly protein TadG [Limimaricola cinnabarinus LL-001]